MDIRNLTTFVHVAELGNFSRAAERLGYSQPTISVQIRQLEQELGFRLFDRIGHSVRLTDKGRDTLSYAQQVCRLCQQMTFSDNEENSRETLIRVATSDSLSAPLLYECFPHIRKAYPNIHLKLTTAGTEDLFSMLDHNEVDIVCTLDSHIYNTNYCIAGEKSIGVHFVVNTDSPLADNTSLSKDDLMSQNMLLTETGMSYRRLLDEWLAKNSLEIHPVLEAGQADLICSLVEMGLGCSFLPDYITEDAVSRKTVKRLSAEGFYPELWKQILYHREKWVSPSMQTVLGIMTDHWL
ncbi:MAG: LysR family transcriptional regulator [Oscillospiraceae bacterium]|nr:LysR family transcriptional regulator [Oscillospiraceae bacterium]